MGKEEREYHPITLRIKELWKDHVPRVFPPERGYKNEADFWGRFGKQAGNTLKNLGVRDGKGNLKEPSTDIILAVKKEVPEVSYDWLLDGKEPVFVNPDSMITNSEREILLRTLDTHADALEGHAKSIQARANTIRQEVQLMKEWEKHDQRRNSTAVGPASSAETEQQ